MRSIEIKIYYTQDYDLMLLHKYGHINVKEAVKEVLYAYIFKKEPFIPISERKRNLKSRYCYRISVSFDSNEEKEILDFLDTIVEIPRSSFIKTLLRVYLGTAIIDLFLEYDSGKEKYLYKNVSRKQRNVMVKTETLPERKETKKKEQINSKVSVINDTRFIEKKKPVENEKDDTEDELTYLFMDMLEI